MGLRGKQPQSAAALELTGSRHAADRKATETRLVALESTPPPPAWVMPGARAHWDDIAGDLVGRRLLTRADLEPLAILCDLLASYVAASETVQAEGAFVTSDRGNRGVHPAMQLQLKLGKEVASQARAFGRGLSARLAMNMRAEAAPGTDPYDKFFAFPHTPVARRQR